MKDIIASYCKQLKLGSRIAEQYSDIQANTHEEFLTQLLAAEAAHRAVQRKNRLIKQANFDILKTFNGFEWQHIKLPKRLTKEDLMEVRFLDHKENLIMYGAVGTGKTHLATAIGIEACNRGKRVKFYRTAALVNQLVEAHRKGALNGSLEQFECLDLVILDEWGYIPLSQEGSQLLFQVVANCYEKRSVIITTNLEFSRWGELFCDEMMTNAMIDRLIHHAHLLNFTGESYRLRNSIMRCDE